MPLLRWGLLGTARITRLLIPAIRATGRSVVAAVASRDQARAAAYAADWSIPDACRSYDALLAADVDIVYNPLPNSEHVPWTLRAIGAGKHVLCEKPLALKACDIDQIAAAVARCHVCVTEGFMYRHHAQTARVLELLADGAIGELRMTIGAFTYPRSRDRDVRLDAALGGGALWDVGCYPVSFANLVAGAAPVSVDGGATPGPTGVDEQFAGAIRYANGVDAQIAASFRAAYHTTMRLVGTAGVIELDRPFRPEPRSLIRLRRQATVENIDVTGSAIFVDQILDIEDAVLAGRTPRITLAESRQLCVTLEALHESARTGTRVELPGDAPQ